MRALAAAVVVLGCLGVPGCSDRDRPGVTAARDPQPPRRVILPPTGTVRPLPPHAIRADGIGPYKLGDKVAQILAHLPAGPRIARIEIPGIVRTSVIRAEDDTVLIGGDAGTSTFVAVVAPEVALTESGVHVGSTRAELEQALGPLVDELERARDPRLAVPSKLRNARAVLADDRIIAIVVTEEPAPRPAPERDPCPRPASTPKAFGICMGDGELVEVHDGALSVRPVASRSAVSVRAPNLVFAAPLRNAADGRDELVVITRVDDDHQRRWSLTAYRVDGGKITRTVDPEPLYTLSSAQSRWIGAELRDVDLYFELTSRSDGIEVGGLLTTRANEKIREVAVISSKVVGRRHAKATPPEPADAGVPRDAGGEDAQVPLDAPAAAGSAGP